MNRVLTVCFAVVLLSTIHLTARAQNHKRPFHPLAESIENAIKERFPSWKLSSIPPAQPKGAAVAFPEDVIIDQWSSDDVAVRVVIINHPSKEEAKKGLKEFIANTKADESLQDTGNDEAYGWGDGSAVAFRKGRYTVYVTTAPVIHEDETTVTKASHRETKLGKTVAQLVAKFLKDL